MTNLVAPPADRPRAKKPRPCDGRRGVLPAIAVVAALLLWSSMAGAVGDPELDWWTIETAHFRIHYEKNLEPIAERLARLSEAIHERLIGPFGYSPSVRTEVALTDNVESANGSASALPTNIIRLYVTAPGDLSALGDYDDWYLGLMTHEYVHILHVDNISGIPALVNVFLGKTLVPNQVQPRWIIEGLATVAESAYSSGGRIRSSLFDMFVRADFLEDNVAGLDQMSSDPRRWPGATIYYLYGSRFLQWVVDVYGADVLRAVAADYGASIIPWGINRAIRRQTGKTYVELYEGFKDTSARRYARQMRSVERRGLREGRRLTFHGREVEYPRFLPAAARGSGSPYQIVYFRDDNHNRPGIYHFDLDGTGAGSPPDETLWARTSGSSPVDFSADGNMIFASVVPFARVYRRSDLFSLARGSTSTSGSEPERKRLTVGLRATAPSLLPNGQQVVFTRNDRGTTSLMAAERSADGALSGVRTLVASRPLDQVFTPVVSPDGTRVAYSAWTAGGFRDIHVVDLQSGQVRELTHDRALDTNPCWSTDGDRLYFASDRTGIYNIYELEIASGKLRQVTNVRTGALMPTVSDDGKRLVYVGYTSAGYDLFAMDLDPARYLRALPPPNDRPQPYAPPPPVAMTKSRYSPWSTLRPYAWQFEYAPGSWGGNALTLQVAGADIAGHHAFAATVVADPNAPVPVASFDYAYTRLPFDLSLRIANGVTLRADYRFNDQIPEYLEYAYAVRTGISYAEPFEFGQHRIGLSHTLTFLDSSLPVAELGPLDPLSQPTVEPFRGMLSTLHAGYNVSNVEGSRDTAGPARGLSLSLGVDLADEYTGSDDSFYAATYEAVGYLPMPWPGAHTLAVRSAGGLSAGQFARRSIFAVGGYNLENVAFPDTLTTTLFDGTFVLRGYEPSAYRGTAYMLNQLEYRLPLAEVDHGISTVPLYLRRIDANAFVDWGGAFNRFDFEHVRLFKKGALVYSPDLHTGIGGELWFHITLGYVVPLQLRLGYALGLSAAAIPGGQAYFIAAAAF